MAMCTILHDRGHALHQFVHVVLAQAIMVCIALPLLQRILVWMIAGNEPHGTIGRLSNRYGVPTLCS